MSTGRAPNVLNRPLIALLAGAVAALVITGAVLIGRWSAPASAAPASSEPASAPQSETAEPHPDRTEWVNGHLLRVGSICLLARPC